MRLIVEKCAPFFLLLILRTVTFSLLAFHTRSNTAFDAYSNNKASSHCRQGVVLNGRRPPREKRNTWSGRRKRAPARSFSTLSLPFVFNAARDIITLQSLPSPCPPIRPLLAAFCHSCRHLVRFFGVASRRHQKRRRSHPFRRRRAASAGEKSGAAPGFRVFPATKDSKRIRKRCRITQDDGRVFLNGSRHRAKACRLFYNAHTVYTYKGNHVLVPLSCVSCALF